MSDFDKEAERERLREKYEQDEADRENTERMSELLLKGATMTNAHCGECGDPIFRYEGQEFCPTCQEPVGDADGNGAARPASADEASDESAVDGSDDAAAAESGSEQADRSGSGTDDGRSESAETPMSGLADEGRGESAGASTAGAADDGAGHPRAVGARESLPAETGERAPVPREETPRRESPQRESGEDDLGAARESLTRALTRFAREAERTDDPRRAREHLEAAREAAAALASLSEVR